MAIDLKNPAVRNALTVQMVADIRKTMRDARKGNVKATDAYRKVADIAATLAELHA